MPGVICFGHTYGIITPTLHMARKGTFEENVRVLEILVGQPMSKVPVVNRIQQLPDAHIVNRCT